MYKEQSLVTKNGVTIYHYKNPNINSFYISLYLRAGSIFEEHSGITHFLEHAAIRNVGALMDGNLYSILDKYGIEFNATTYYEMVQFYVSGVKENFSIASEIIARVLSPIILSSSEISTERDRIKAEIRESDDRTSLSTFSNNIVHEGTNLANLITGTLGSVEKINGKRLEEYRKSVMTTGNIFFYLTGNFTDDDVCKLASEIEKYNVEKGEKTENIAPVCAKFGKREPKVYIKNADFTMIRFCFDVDMSKVSLAENDILYDMLFSGYNSLFFIEMSERRGLFYDISGYSEKYKNIGELSFSFEVRGGMLYEAVETAIDLLSRFKSSTPDESAMMKASYVTNSPLLYDNASELNFAFAYDNHIMNEDYGSVEDRARRYAEITPARIREVASVIFRPENLTLTLKGNKKKIDISKLEEMIKKL